MSKPPTRHAGHRSRSRSNIARQLTTLASFCGLYNLWSATSKDLASKEMQAVEFADAGTNA
jgi:hypothetical protein